MALASTPLTPGTGLLLVALVLAAVTAVMLVRQRVDGRFRAATTEHLSPADLGRPLGRRATFVQFSSTLCATCPQVRRILNDIAAEHPGVGFVDIASEDHDRLVRRLGIQRTPTVLLLDPDGVVTSRTSGAVRRDQALSALATTRS